MVLRGISHNCLRSFEVNCRFANFLDFYSCNCNILDNHFLNIFLPDSSMYLIKKCEFWSFWNYKLFKNTCLFMYCMMISRIFTLIEKCQIFVKCAFFKLRFILDRHTKTFTENWDSKTPSFGSFLAYLETTAKIFF